MTMIWLILWAQVLPFAGRHSMDVISTIETAVLEMWFKALLRCLDPHLLLSYMQCHIGIASPISMGSQLW